MPQEKGSEGDILSGTGQREVLSCKEVATKASVAPQTGKNLPSCPSNARKLGLSPFVLTTHWTGAAHRALSVTCAKCGMWLSLTEGSSQRWYQAERHKPLCH